MCTQIGEVLKTGRTFYTDREQCFCTGGVIATGAASPLTEQERDEMIKVHFEISKGYKDVPTALQYERAVDNAGRTSCAWRKRCAISVASRGARVTISVNIVTMRLKKSKQFFKRSLTEIAAGKIEDTFISGCFRTIKLSCQDIAHISIV